MALKVVYLNDFAELDPAQKVLLEEEEAKKRRKQEETRIALERIQERVSTTLHQYEDEEEKKNERSEEEKSVEVSFENITDPVELYKLLADARMKSKYEKHLTIVVVQFEKKFQEKEQVLNSLDEFFQETQAGNTEQLISELEAEEIDFEEATLGLESALATATQAATKLVAIEREISQLLTVAAAYPDTKKGRKNLEKALVKAQDETQTLSTSLQSLKVELDQSKEKCEQLQKSLESKTAECGKLRKSADEAKKLQLSNDNLKAELTNISSMLKKTEEEMLHIKNNPPQTNIQPELVIDETRIKELEQALEESNVTNEQLLVDKNKCEIQLQQELENLKEQYEVKIAEMKAHHEEQLQSLVVDTDLFEEEEEDGAGMEEQNREIEEMEDSQFEVMEDSTREIKESVTVDVSEHKDSEVVTQKESVANENALKSELADVKAKSRKIMTSLKAQLVEAEMKLQNQESDQKDEIEMLRTQMGELQQQKEYVEEQYQQQQNEVKERTEQCKQHTSKILELEQTITELQQEMKNFKTTLLPQDQLGSPTQNKDFISHSTQWSDGVMSHSTTPRSTISFDRPLIPMEEVLHSTHISTPLSSRSMLGGSGTGSISNTHIHASPLHGNSILPLADSMQIPTLALSRLSRHSQGSDQVTIDHPIVQEWNKAYEQIIRFKENIVQMLQANEMSTTLAEIIQDLMAQGELSLDSDREIQGQVTQMRFTLALTLHQLETALQEFIWSSKPTQISDESAGEENSDKFGSRIATLQKQLHQANERHRTEFQQSQDTIANLSSKIDSLKAEIFTLRRYMSEESKGENSGVVFFTRLDSERNEKALEEAYVSQQISEEEVHSISSNMEEYLSIPGQRLQQIKTQIQQQTSAKKAIRQMQNHSVSPEYSKHIIEMIQQMQDKRQNQFVHTMTSLSSKRLRLADQLQKDLTKAEKQAGVFLVKPIYPTRSHASHSIMVPLNRSPPSYRTTISPTFKKRYGDSSRSTPHPTMQLINDLRSELTSRQQYQKSPKVLDTTTTQSSIALTRPVSKNDSKWTVSSSQTQSANIHYSPVLPRLVELEITKMRQPESLLGPIARTHIQAIHNSKNTRGFHNEKGTTPSVLPPIHIPSH